MIKRIINIKEFSKNDMLQIKGIAILMMVFLHLFCRKEFSSLYDVKYSIDGLPVIYYISLVCSSCVPIYLFCSGYGLYAQYEYDKNSVSNINRGVNLLLRFELVVVLTILSGYLLKSEDIMKFNLIEILKNAILVEHTICGAWWYMQTYIVLLLASKFLFEILDNNNAKKIIIISIVIYCIGYLQRVKNFFISSDNWLISDILYMIASLGFCQLSFLIGAIFRKYKIISIVRIFIEKYKYTQIICFDIICLLGVLLIHGKFESMSIDPIVGIVLMLIFSTIKFNNIKYLAFFGKHSTNIWLVHMLLYQKIASEIIFSSRTPIIIFIITLLLCLLVSYLINIIYCMTQHLLKKLKNNMKVSKYI